MRYTLENENLKVEIDSFGAEIKSVKRKSETIFCISRTSESENLYFIASVKTADAFFMLGVPGLFYCRKGGDGNGRQ